MKTLFNPPLTRDTDVITSHEAADKMVKSGKLGEQEKWVYFNIKRISMEFGGLNFTTKEIAQLMCSTFHPYAECYDICRKRFSGIHNKGKIERLNTEGGLYKEGDELMRRGGCAVWRLL